VPVSTAELSWRVLGFVNGLRLLASSSLATLFVSIMPETIGQLDPALFAGSATAYFLYSVISISSIRRRSPDIVLQTWTGVFADVLVLSLLTYASGGVNDGIAALVVLSVRDQLHPAPPAGDVRGGGGGLRHAPPTGHHPAGGYRRGR
jgi:two-component system sensor histidine kinase PilS (NtrC family)